MYFKIWSPGISKATTTHLPSNYYSLEYTVQERKEKTVYKDSSTRSEGRKRSPCKTMQYVQCGRVDRIHISWYPQKGA